MCSSDLDYGAVCPKKGAPLSYPVLQGTSQYGWTTFVDTNNNNVKGAKNDCFIYAKDGTLKFKQRYYHLHMPDTADDSGADGMRVDRDGRLYVATRLGIQVCDQAGRVNCIIPTPNGKVANFTFGGENFDTLYAACGDKIFKRKLKVKGAHAWQAPNKPANPRL